jgi:hypothetical protein
MTAGFDMAPAQSSAAARSSRRELGSRLHPMSPARDLSARFTGRARDYERGRPGYPEAMFDRLVELFFGRLAG